LIFFLINYGFALLTLPDTLTHACDWENILYIYTHICVINEEYRIYVPSKKRKESIELKPVVKFLIIGFVIVIYSSLLQILVCITLYLCPISIISIVLARYCVRRV